MASGARIPFSGVLLVVFGGLFLADQLGIIHFAAFFRVWWPAILVLAGLLQLIERPASPFGPLILLTVGTALLLANLKVVQLASVWRLWPILLIVAGLNILMSHRAKG